MIRLRLRLRLCLCLYWLQPFSLVGEGEAELVFRVPGVSARPEAKLRSVGIAKPAASDPMTATPVFASSSARTDDDHPERFYVEHEVSAREAKEAIRGYREAQTTTVGGWWGAGADGDTGALGCGRCGSREQRYCQWSVLSDHCCCERRYTEEPFPFIPHTCYVGGQRCSLETLTGNCARYARIRECCCIRPLIIRWKSILGEAHATRTAPGMVTAMAMAQWLMLMGH